MKRVIAALAFCAAAMGFGSAQAATTSGTFNVSITLTSVCTLSAIADVTFAYTSLGGAVGATGGGFTMTCTTGLPYTFGLAVAAGGAPGTATIAPPADNAVNLLYTLGLSAAGGTGDATAQPYNITGNMVAGQSGTCGSASCTNGLATNKTHTLWVTY